MHHHVVLFTAWRYRRGLPGAEATLRRVADERIVLASTGGADFTHPRGSAVRVEGGYRVSGRKIFVSQSPVGDVMATMFPYDDPDDGRLVLNVSVPLTADGVRVLDSGHSACGARASRRGRRCVRADVRALARRPHGKIDGPLQVIIARMPPISACTSALPKRRDHMLASITGTAKAEDRSCSGRWG
jgi:acyl-CoA dehydrogenase